MIVDSSALLGIIEDEPGSDALVHAAAPAWCRMSVASRLEAPIVADSRSASGTPGPESVTTGEPLLFVGEEVTHTDIAPALS